MQMASLAKCHQVGPTAVSRIPIEVMHRQYVATFGVIRMATVLASPAGRGLDSGGNLRPICRVLPGFGPLADRALSTETRSPVHDHELSPAKHHQGIAQGIPPTNADAPAPLEKRIWADIPIPATGGLSGLHLCPPRADKPGPGPRQ
jgi:hypothetical protein